MDPNTFAGIRPNVVLITLISFAMYFVVDDLYFGDVRAWLNGYFEATGVSHFLAYTLHGIPILIGLYLIHKSWAVSGPLGMDGSWIKALVFAIVCTLPMFLGFSFMFELNTALTMNHFLISMVAAALFEELFFRGFLFGQLFRYGRLGFIPAVFLGALHFALIHFYQSDDLLTLGGIFLTTFAGSVIFAWVYVEWEFNLWVPIFLHFLMNLSWSLFAVSDNALGGIGPNIFRIITLGLVIGLTWLYKRKYFGTLRITKATLWTYR